MEKKIFKTQKGPESVGPYSTAIIYGDMVYISGMGPIDPETKMLVKGSVEQETHRAIKNVAIVLDELGGCLADVLKTTLYMADMNDYKVVNEIYMEYFGPDFPARTTIQAGRLPFDIKVEIEVIAAFRKK